MYRVTSSASAGFIPVIKHSRFIRIYLRCGGFILWSIVLLVLSRMSRELPHCSTDINGVFHGVSTIVTSISSESFVNLSDSRASSADHFGMFPTMIQKQNRRMGGKIRSRASGTFFEKSALTFLFGSIFYPPFDGITVYISSLDSP